MDTSDKHYLSDIINGASTQECDSTDCRWNNMDGTEAVWIDGEEPDGMGDYRDTGEQFLGCPECSSPVNETEVDLDEDMFTDGMMILARELMDPWHEVTFGRSAIGMTVWSHQWPGNITQHAYAALGYNYCEVEAAEVLRAANILWVQKQAQQRKEQLANDRLFAALESVGAAE